MKKYILRRVMQYTEKLEIEVENLDTAKEILNSDIEFELQHDDEIYNKSIEYIGDVEELLAKLK